MSDREIMDAKRSTINTSVPLNDPKVEKEVNKIVSQLAGANIKELPDAYLHQKISFIKSGVRILGYIFLPFNLVFATILLILSEVIGIIEELV
jgi:hypothetical protein